MGGVPVSYSLPISRAFLPCISELEALVSPRTKMLVVNSPANPTGQVFSRALMGELAAFARRHNIFILSDEIYSEIVFAENSASAPSILEHDAGRHVVVISGMSKNYSMTGFRVGFTRAHPEYVQVGISMWVKIYTYICMHIYMRICMYICIYIYVHICMGVGIYLYMYVACLRVD